jgi:uncharacterized protein
MCIVSREVQEEDALVRFVLSPDGVVTPDLLRKLPGRGVWVSALETQIAEAARKGLFARGFGAAVKLPEDLPGLVGVLLRKQAVASLSLARKAGEALCGFMKVDEALRKGPVQVLLHAAGSSVDGANKLNWLAKSDTVVSDIFRPDEMDLAFGRVNVIHAAVARGKLADKLVLHMRRMAAYDGLEISNLGQKN